MIKRRTVLDDLVNRIERYCATTGYKPSYVGLMAADYGTLYSRLRDGKTVTLDTLERVVKWLEKAEAAVLSGDWKAKATYKGGTKTPPKERKRRVRRRR